MCEYTMVLPFTLQIATQWWCELHHGIAETQLYPEANDECHTFVHEARRKSVTTSWDCFPTLCWLDFGGGAGGGKFCILFQCDHYPIFFFFAPNKQEQEQIGSDGSVCAVLESASWVMGLAVGAERSRGCSGRCPCTLSTPRAAVSPEWGRHHRTALFNLKSAGFKALCWQ